MSEPEYSPFEHAMAEKTGDRLTKRRSAGPGPFDLDETIIQLIRDHGEASFRAIVREVNAAFPVSRATVARRLARLCRSSRVVRLQHGRYATISASARTRHMVLRMRAIDVTEFISPDGSSRIEVGKEFSVRSGLCDRLTFGVSPIAHLPARDVEVTCARRTKVVTHNERGRTIITVRFEPPIRESPRLTHRVLVSYRLGPGFYTMQQPGAGSVPPAPTRPPRNIHSMGVLSNPDIGVFMEADEKTTISLRIHYPSGFPRGRVRPEVASIQSDKKLDHETESLRVLSKKSGGSLGVQVRRDLVTMSIENPVIHCYYGFTWAPARAEAVAPWARQPLEKAAGRGASSH